MKIQRQVIAGALLALAATPALADTFVGKIAFKNAAGEIQVKSSEVELAPAQIDAVRLRIEGVENMADKVRFRVIEGEGRKIVLAVFRNVRDMPMGSSLIIKGTLLDGSNGKLFFGDILQRTCQDQAQQPGQEENPGQQEPGQGGGGKGQMLDGGEQDQYEDGFLQQIIDGQHSYQAEHGCMTEYRGGLLLARQNAAQGDQGGQGGGL